MSRIFGLRDVLVPLENLVGGLNHGFSIILDELDRERPVVAAGMMGIARSSFEETVSYSSTREQFGRPIRDFEGVGFKIADMAVKLAASRLLILRAARALDLGRPARKGGGYRETCLDRSSVRGDPRCSASPWRIGVHEGSSDRVLLQRCEVHDDRWGDQ